MRAKINRREFILGATGIGFATSLLLGSATGFNYYRFKPKVVEPRGENDQLTINRTLERYGFVELAHGETYNTSGSIIFPDRPCCLIGLAKIFNHSVEDTIKIGNEGWLYPHQELLDGLWLESDKQAVAIRVWATHLQGGGLTNLVLHKNKDGLLIEHGISLPIWNVDSINNADRNFVLGGRGKANNTILHHCKAVRGRIGVEGGTQALGCGISDDSDISSNDEIGAIFQDSAPRIINSHFENNPVCLRGSSLLDATLYAVGNRFLLKGGQTGMELQGWHNYIGVNNFDMQSPEDIAIHLLSGTAYSEIVRQQYMKTKGTKIVDDSGGRTNIIKE